MNRTIQLMGCWLLLASGPTYAANEGQRAEEQAVGAPAPQGDSAAQAPNPDVPPPPSATATATPVQPNLSVEEMRRLAKDYVTKMGDKFTDVSTKAAQAKNENNISRYNCLNTKATLVGGLLTMGNSVYVEMSTSNDSGLLKGDLQKIEIAWNKVNSTAAEAEGCFGNLAFKSGAETVDVTTPSDLPKGDPTTNTTPVNVEGRSTSTSLSM